MITVINRDIKHLRPGDLVGAHHLITDPPYSAHVHDKARSCAGEGSKPVDRDLGFKHLTPEMRAHVCKLAKDIAGWSIVFADLEGCAAWKDDATAAGLSYVRTVPWIRWSMPALTGDRPPCGAEGVLHFGEDDDGPDDPAIVHLARRSRKAWNGPGGLTHYDTRCLRQNKKGTPPKHGAEKPIGLMLDIVSWFTLPGQAVVDLFAGFGTTLLACEILGRNSIGFERDANNADQIHDRLDAPLRGRDAARDIRLIEEWIEKTLDEAQAVPYPRKKLEENAYKKAQHRIEDATRAARFIQGLA